LTVWWFKVDLESRFFEVLGIDKPCPWKARLEKELNNPSKETFYGQHKPEVDVYEWPEAGAL
jgi:hypothetical protein